MKSLTHELDELLRESLEAAIERESSAFDRASAPFGERVILHGAGRLGMRTLDRMRQVGFEPLAFSDSNPTLEGKHIEGIPVFSPEKAAQDFSKNAAFVVSVWNGTATDRMAERLQKLTDLGCERVFPVGLLCWKYPDSFLPYYPLDLPHKVLPDAKEVKAAFSLFADEESRREYVGQIRFRLLLDYDGLGTPYRPDHYFRSDLYDLKEDEVLIDCGAFDGDTLASFITLRGNSFGSVTAYEPDPLNWKKLQERLETMPHEVRAKITPLPYALGSAACTVQFDSTGTDVAKIGQGSVSVECVTLDYSLRYLTPTFIKFDIEGAELDALRGAQEVIARSRPVLAVSCYHQQNHLWKIPLELAMICRDYKFFLRPHGSEGWDLLCYAVPIERLRSR